MGDVEYRKCICPHCNGGIEYPAEGEGSTIDCPHCSQPIELPSTIEDLADSTGKPDIVEILSAFNQPIRRSGVSVFYTFGLLLAAFMMFLLPVIYLALIVLAIAGVWYYAVNFRGLLSSTQGGVQFFLLKIVLYVGPLFAGAVMVFFMIKPLLARRAPCAQPLALNPANEPHLFAFIAKICDAVGAPMPARIDLDCKFNASASFRHGTFSFLGNDLVLTLGLPLIAGVSLEQFASLLAHEFGHFTQGFAMRLNFVVRSVNYWFIRVVYERDAWDLALVRLAHEEQDWRVSIVIGLARLGVWFSRRILQCLMLIGHAASCFLSRQMEYHADSCAIRLAGSGVFETMIRRVCVLSAVLGVAYKDMQAKWNLNRRLPANFPAYLMVKDTFLAPESRERIESTMGLRRTGPLDTHPSDGDRIRRARRAQEEGLFHCELPANSLFANFDAISRQVTCLHYSDDLGIPFTQAMLDEMVPK